MFPRKWYHLEELSLEQGYVLSQYSRLAVEYISATKRGNFRRKFRREKMCFYEMCP